MAKRTIKGPGMAVEVTKEPLTTKEPLKLLQKKIAMKEARAKLVIEVREGKNSITELSIEISRIDDILDKTMLKILNEKLFN